MNPSIHVHQLCKRFRRSTFGSRRTMRVWLSRFGAKPTEDNFVQALDGISFSVEGGQILGVIGANGSGKSTLLRLVGGVGIPDQGTIETHGRFGALLELGAGSFADLSGRDNIIVGCVIAGLSREEAIARVDEIAEFAEIEEFIDSPMRTYSTGMQMRLAFGAVVFSDPRILLVDEVLAVGDLSFQQKCLKKISELRDNGACILLASHDLEQVLRICDSALWLESGRQRMLDDPWRVIDEYRKKFSAATVEVTPKPVRNDDPADGDADSKLILGESRLGSQEVRIESLRVLDADGNVRESFKSGAPIGFEVEYDAVSAVDGLIVGVTVANDEGQICIDVNSGAPDVGRRIPRGSALATLDMSSLDLRPGKYKVSVGLYNRGWDYAYDYHWNNYELLVTPGSFKARNQNPHCHWQIRKQDRPRVAG